jgi:hypothetical protein
MSAMNPNIVVAWSRRTCADGAQAGWQAEKGQDEKLENYFSQNRCPTIFSRSPRQTQREVDRSHPNGSRMQFGQQSQELMWGLRFKGSAL